MDFSMFTDRPIEFKCFHPYCIADRPKRFRRKQIRVRSALKASDFVRKRAELDAVVRRAMGDWNAVCGVRLKWTTNRHMADLTIAAHGPGTEGVTSCPCCSDAMVLYVSRETTSIQELWVRLMHGLGHAIGIGHQPDGMMAAKVPLNVTGLSASDIKAAVELYGGNR